MPDALRVQRGRFADHVLRLPEVGPAIKALGAEGTCAPEAAPVRFHLEHRVGKIRVLGHDPGASHGPFGDVFRGTSQRRVHCQAFLHVSRDHGLDIARGHDVEGTAAFHLSGHHAALGPRAEHRYGAAQDLFCRDAEHVAFQLLQRRRRPAKVFARHCHAGDAYDQVGLRHGLEDRGVFSQLIDGIIEHFPG